MDGDSKPSPVSPKKSHSVIRIVNIFLFLIGLGISTYQTVLLVQNVITQPTISTIIPIQSAALERPDVLICKNIYAELLASNQMKYDNINLFRLLAIQSRDTAPYLKDTLANLLNVSLVDSNKTYHKLKTVAAPYFNCSAMLGKCAILTMGMPVMPVNECCSMAKQHTTEFDICYRISPEQPQDAPNRFSAAVYQLRYPEQSSDRQYTVHLVPKAAYANVYETPVTTVVANTQVDVEVQKQVAVRINYTEKSTTNPRGKNLVCVVLLMEAAVQEYCQCVPDLPLARQPEQANKYEQGSRSCLPFEKWRCWFGIMKGSRLAEMNKKITECRRFKRVCREVTFEAKLSTLKLSKYFYAYYGETGGGDNQQSKTSMIYVYYGSLTTLYYREVRALSWLTVISSLGGIWGLWLGLSLYGTAQLFFGGLYEICNQCKKISKKKPKPFVAGNVAILNKPSS